MANLHNDDIVLLQKIGEGIKSERNRAGLSQKELASLAGVHKNAIGLIERGEQAATVITLSMICSALGLGMSEFFERINL